jgi:hypothetical protein
MMDCYHNAGIGKVNTLPKAYAYAVALSISLGGKPIAIGETAVRPTGLTTTTPSTLTDAQHAQLVRDGIAYLNTKSNNFVAVSWFDSNKLGQTAQETDWRLEPWPTSTALWKAQTVASVLAHA